MTVREFIDSIDIASNTLKVHLKQGYQEELDQEATLELRDWICDEVESQWQEWKKNHLDA